MMTILNTHRSNDLMLYLSEILCYTLLCICRNNIIR